MKKLLEKLLKINILTSYNMIVLSFTLSLCCCCCCYLPIDFHHRSFRKWHTVNDESLEGLKLGESAKKSVNLAEGSLANFSTYTGSL